MIPVQNYLRWPTSNMIVFRNKDVLCAHMDNLPDPVDSQSLVGSDICSSGIFSTSFVSFLELKVSLDLLGVKTL